MRFALVDCNNFLCFLRAGVSSRLLRGQTRGGPEQQ